MQTYLSTIDSTKNENSILIELFGGLSIMPYGIFLLLSAYAFAQGWLNWQSNGGPPFLGGFLAFLLDKLIVRYYRKKYNFVFTPDRSNQTRTNISLIKRIFWVWLFAGLIAWFIEINTHAQILATPLWFSILVLLHGFDLLQKKWVHYGMTYILLSIIPLGLSLIPFIFNLSTTNADFGFEGISELFAIGSIIFIASMVEHIIFIKNFRPLPY